MMPLVKLFTLNALFVSGVLLVYETPFTGIGLMNLLIVLSVLYTAAPRKKICPICQKNYSGRIDYCRDCDQQLQSKTARKLKGKISQVLDR